MDDDLIKAIDDLRDTVAAYLMITGGDELECEFDSTDTVEAIKEITQVINDIM